MKFDKKVMESGIVAAFTLVVTMSSVCGTNVTTQAPNSQEVELSAEPIKVSDGAMKATKERLERTVVAASIAENDPEQEAKEVQDVPEEEKKAESEDSSEKAVEEVVAEKETAEEASETTEDEEAKEAESSEDVKETAEEASETKEVEVSEGKAEEKEETPETEAASEEKTVRDGLLEVGSEEISPWASKLLPNVEDYLNVRTEASDEAELAGKLHKGASADILERGDEWTKIKSGNVEGYVKNEFCVTGLEAEDLANQVGTTYATATTGGVRVRENASSSEDTEILDVLEEGGQVKVDTQTEASEGWVAVKTEEGTGYVSAEYVNVELKLGKAISIEEERAAIAAAEAEKARKARQAAASAGTSQRGAVAASYDDVTLLGALIQCEAGSEPYEGQLAVGAVVMNRLRAGYAGSISGVIYQSGQFSPASSGKLASVLANGVSGSCMQAAQAAIGGASNVGGATSFRSASSGTPGIVIGNHVFF